MTWRNKSETTHQGGFPSAAGSIARELHDLRELAASLRQRLNESERDRVRLQGEMLMLRFKRR